MRRSNADRFHFVLGALIAAWAAAAAVSSFIPVAKLAASRYTTYVFGVPWATKLRGDVNMRNALIGSWICMLLLLGCEKDAGHHPGPSAATSTNARAGADALDPGESSQAAIPFPDAMEKDPDPRIVQLISVWVRGWHSDAGIKAHHEIVSMGAEAVPSLIIIVKRAANTEPLIVEKQGTVSDISRGELRASLIALREIGDRRALPAISALVKYDTKAGRFRHALAGILLRGSDEQLQSDARSGDPNIAHMARVILDHPEQYDYSRKKNQNSNYETTLRTMVVTDAIAPVDGMALDFKEFRNEGRLAGIALGDTMHDVVSVWGKPADLHSMHNGNIWTHRYANASLLYHDYKLVRITIGRHDGQRFRFDNGLVGQMTLDAVKQLLGPPRTTYHAGVSYLYGDRVLTITFQKNRKFPENAAEWATATIASVSIEQRSSVR